MKRTILLAALLVAGCASPKAETPVSIIVPGDDPVRVFVYDYQLDTLLTPEAGKAEITLATNPGIIATLALGGVQSSVIPEGRPVTVDFTGEKPSVSVKGRGSLNAKLDAEEAWEADLVARAEGLSDLPDEEQDAQMEHIQADFLAHNKDLIKANPDNWVGAYAFVKIWSDLSVDEADALLQGLSPEVKQTRRVQSIADAIVALRASGEGQPFIDFEADGQKLSDYVGKGKWVLVDFWASWCGPCRREIPNILSVYNQYKGDDFEVLGVAVWDEKDASLKAVEELGITYPQILDASVGADKYGIKGIPHIILFAPDGTISKRDLRGEAIGQAVREALGK